MAWAGRSPAYQLPNHIRASLLVINSTNQLPTRTAICPSAAQLLSQVMINHLLAGLSSDCPPANCPPAGQLPTDQLAARQLAARRLAHARRLTTCTSSPLYLFRQPATRRPAVRRLCLSDIISLLTSYYISLHKPVLKPRVNTSRRFVIAKLAPESKMILPCLPAGFFFLCFFWIGCLVCMAIHHALRMNLSRIFIAADRVVCVLY